LKPWDKPALPNTTLWLFIASAVAFGTAAGVVVGKTIYYMVVLRWLP
jgi:hypothetical protein